MFFVEIFLLLIFTVLCGILLALWRIREQLERIGGEGGKLAPSSAATSSAHPPAA
jgi:hypothetical protein